MQGKSPFEGREVCKYRACTEEECLEAKRSNGFAATL